jgi:hypothetical protein
VAVVDGQPVILSTFDFIYEALGMWFSFKGNFKYSWYYA